MRRRWVTWVVAGLVMGAGVVGIYLVERAYVQQANDALGLPVGTGTPLVGPLTQMDVLATLAPMAVWLIAVSRVARSVAAGSTDADAAAVPDPRPDDALQG